MNQESLERTLERRETWFWSRSRQELWRKGATSGNTQAVRSVSLDCDGDAVLVRVDQTGVACHTGAATCFHDPLTDAAAEPFAAIADLVRTVDERADDADPESSYTARLLAKGIDTVCKKVGEEATEVVIAAKGGSTGRWSTRAPTCSTTSPCCGAPPASISTRWRPSSRRADLPRHDPAATRGTPPPLRRGPRRVSGPGRGARPGGPARPGVAGAQLHRRLRDPGERLPQAARRRAGLPTRVGGARAPGPPLDDRRAPAGRHPRGRRPPGDHRPRRRRPGRWTPRTPSAPSRTRSTRSTWRPRPPSWPSPAARSGYFGYDLVRTVEHLPDQPPDDLGVPGPDRPDHRPRRGLRPSGPLADDRRALRPRPRGRRRGGLLEHGRDPHPAQGPALRAGAARRAQSRGGADPRAGDEQRVPGALRGLGRARARVRLRRRRLPGGALPALLRADQPRPLLGVPGPAHGQPIARTCTSSRPTRSRWSDRRPRRW